MAFSVSHWSGRLGNNIQQFGTAAEKRAYGALDASVGFNTNPWVKYSSNAMGAGDALARTVIGRMEMRHRAIRKALKDPAVDPNDAIAIARATEDNFRRSIFKENADGKWVVHDSAAKLAGDDIRRQKMGIFESVEPDEAMIEEVELTRDAIINFLTRKY